MTARDRILPSGPIPRPIRPAPCSGTLISWPDGGLRGQIIGRCGCVTRFEAVEQDSEFGVFYRLFWLPDTSRQARRLDLTRESGVNSPNARRGGACGNANALENTPKAARRRPPNEVICFAAIILGQFGLVRKSILWAMRTLAFCGGFLTRRSR